MKTALAELRIDNQKMREEKRKLMEISIEQKIAFQEALNKMESRKNGDKHYLDEMERQLSKIKEINIKLEN